MKSERLRYIAYVLYAAFFLTLLLSLFGSSKSGILNFTAEKTLHGTGLNKSKIDSLDNKIDESMYNMDMFAYRMSKIKEFFTGDAAVKPEKIKHEYIAQGIYYPALNAVAFVQRILFFFVSVFMLLAAIIVHLLSKLSSLGERLSRLEFKISSAENLSI